jgi:hypothetical protein
MRCRREPVPSTNGVESFETIELGEEMLQTSREKPLEVVSPLHVSEALRLGRRIDGQLWATRGARDEPVTIVHCFPWTAPGSFISLRDGEEDEFALVRDIADLDVDSRDALEQSLAEAGFVLEIVAVTACEEEVEIRNWEVRTRQGARSFQTQRDDWPRELPGGSLLIRDVAGDLYYVDDPAALDAKSRELLWAFVD